MKILSYITNLSLETISGAGAVLILIFIINYLNISIQTTMVQLIHLRIIESKSNQNFFDD